MDEEKMDEERFESYIKDNMGCELLRHCFENLTEKQIEESFENAIKNNCGEYLLNFCFENLTEKQIK